MAAYCAPGKRLHRVGRRQSHRGYRRLALVDHTFGAGQVRLDLGQQGELGVQLALQGEHLAQARRVAGQPGGRVGDAAPLLPEFGLHPVEGVLQPGGDPDCGRLAVDGDRLREVRPFQQKERLRQQIMPAGAEGAGQVEAAEAADRPAAPGAFPQGKADLRQQRGACRLALPDRPALDVDGELVTAGPGRR